MRKQQQQSTNKRKDSGKNYQQPQPQEELTRLTSSKSSVKPSSSSSVISLSSPSSTSSSPSRATNQQGSQEVVESNNEISAGNQLKNRQDCEEMVAANKRNSADDSSEINVISQSSWPLSNETDFLKSIGKEFESAAVRRMKANSTLITILRTTIGNTIRQQYAEPNQQQSSMNNNRKEILSSIYTIPTAINNATTHLIEFAEYQLYQYAKNQHDIQQKDTSSNEMFILKELPYSDISHCFEKYSDNEVFSLKPMKSIAKNRFVVDSKLIVSIKRKIYTTMHQIVTDIFNHLYDLVEKSINKYLMSTETTKISVVQVLQNQNHHLQLYLTKSELSEWIDFQVFKVRYYYVSVFKRLFQFFLLSSFFFLLNS